MTAPTLTPEELIRSRAFFDAAEFTELVENLDEELPCGSRKTACTESAEWRITRRCCGLAWMLCDYHLEAHRPDTHSGYCISCRHYWRRGTTFDEAYRSVKL